ALHQPELELRPLVVEPAPVHRRDGVVKDDLRPGAPQPPRRLVLEQLFAERDELHSSSATASAASPSPRPVKPSRSVVVARTVTCAASARTASASPSRICSRSGAIRGSSPISTQSALTSSHPASRT